MTGKILVVEDEQSIQTIVRTYLESAGFQVVCVDNGLTALAAAREHQPDLLILDLNLPGMDGIEVAARLRQESEVYILMLTARSEEVDRVTGLRIGADDYLTKPFSPRELVARVEAILRRRRDNGPASNALVFENIRIDPDRYEVSAEDLLLDMTHTEYNVLLELARHSGSLQPQIKTAAKCPRTEIQKSFSQPRAAILSRILAMFNILLSSFQWHDRHNLR